MWTILTPYGEKNIGNFRLSKCKIYSKDIFWNETQKFSKTRSQCTSLWRVYLHNLELPKYSYGIVSKNYLLLQYSFTSTTHHAYQFPKKQIFVQTCRQVWKVHFSGNIFNIAWSRVRPPWSSKYIIDIIQKLNVSIFVSNAWAQKHFNRF